MTSIEDYEDAVWSGLLGAGFTEAELFNAADKGVVLNTIISHCFMNGREVAAVVDGIAKKMRGES